MRRQTNLLAIITVLMAFGVWACDTYTMMPTRTRTAPPPEAGAATAATPPSPYLSEQVKELESRVQSLESRLAELEQAKGPASGPVRETSPSSPGTAAPPPSAAQYPALSSAENKTFSEGMRLYREKKYDAARSKFYQYLKNQPKGSKAAEARYYLADSFYQEKRYQEAAVEFNKVVNLHPESVLAPSALLRQALSYEQLQQKTYYLNALKKLVKNFPRSPEAKEARKRLGEAPVR